MADKRQDSGRVRVPFLASQQVPLRSLGKPVLAAGQQQELERIRRENDAVLSVRRIGARTMTFDELWQTLPIPFGYEHMDELDKRRWQALVEAAFRKGLFDGTHKSASARVNDSRRISDLESAVAEIRASILAVEKIEHPIDKADTILALKTELRYISCALDDPRVDVTPFGYEHMMTASEVIKGLRSALKVIHTWASFPESFDFEQTKRLCMSALGREQ